MVLVWIYWHIAYFIKWSFNSSSSLFDSFYVLINGFLDIPHIELLTGTPFTYIQNIFGLHWAYTINTLCFGIFALMSLVIFFKIIYTKHWKINLK